MQRFSPAGAFRFFRAGWPKQRQMLQNLQLQYQQDRKMKHWRVMLERREQFTFTNGSEKFLVPVTGDDLGQQLFVYGEVEFSKVLDALHQLQWSTVGTLVDIGANVGQVCIPGLRRGIFDSAIAVEADPTNFGCLAINSNLNSVADHIHLIHGAVGSGEVKKLKLALAPSEFGDHRIAVAPHLDANRRTIFVPATTIDDVTSSLDRNRDLIWMDIQGYEAKALRGAERARASRVPMVLEFWPTGILESGEDLSDMMHLLCEYAEFTDLSVQAGGFQPLSQLPKLWESLLSDQNDRDYVDVLLR